MKTSYAAKSNVAKASRTTEKYHKKKSKMRQQTKQRYLTLEWQGWSATHRQRFSLFFWRFTFLHFHKM